MNSAVVFLMAAVSVSGVQIGLAPSASSYIYRNDNNGPASLIQVGTHGYHQPHAFAPPIPIAQPLIYEEIKLGPQPLPYIAAKPIEVEDEEDDDDDESSEDEIDLGHLGDGYEKGEGSDYGEQHHNEHGEKGSKGYKTKGHHAKGASGHYGKGHNEGYHDENEGEKSAHHNEADVHGKHYESGKHYKGGDHGHKKHFSKGEDVTGYHKVFHKDEFKKDHDFYDVADKSGHFNKHGYKKAHHGSDAGGHKEAGHHNSGHDEGDYGKSGHHAKGHLDDAESGHSAEEGHDSHYENEADYEKKGGARRAKDYLYDDDSDFYDDKE